MGNPCEHICLDLHDGTYECSCFYGFTLAVDGYSCSALVSSSGSSSSLAPSSQQAKPELRTGGTRTESTSTSRPPVLDYRDGVSVSLELSPAGGAAATASQSRVAPSEPARRKTTKLFLSGEPSGHPIKAPPAPPEDDNTHDMKPQGKLDEPM